MFNTFMLIQNSFIQGTRFVPCIFCITKKCEALRDGCLRIYVTFLFIRDIRFRCKPFGIRLVSSQEKISKRNRISTYATTTYLSLHRFFLQAICGLQYLDGIRLLYELSSQIRKHHANSSRGYHILLQFLQLP